MARPTGFEPAISSVTGRRDRPASLRAQMHCFILANRASRCKQKIALDFRNGNILRNLAVFFHFFELIREFRQRNVHIFKS